MTGAISGWYRPAHFVLEANAQLLRQRFGELKVSVLTPDGSAHWDANGLRSARAWSLPRPLTMSRSSPIGARKRELLEASRPGTSIPEAEPLIDEPWPPDRPALGPVVLPMGADAGIETALHEAADCRRCHLWEPATQTVFGEGPAHARVMFIGEQPGDQEDVIGRPFVGPAGLMLDRALLEAGIDRRTASSPIGVKHFKFTPRGKHHIHQTPETPEIQACRFWLDVERVRLAPKLVVLLGGTATVPCWAGR